MSDRLLVNVFNVDAALTVARGRGLFAAEGLDVELLVTPNSTDQMRGLGKGSWQIVSTAFDNVLGLVGPRGRGDCCHRASIPRDYLTGLRQA